jgi:hypothetical protein
MRSHNPEIDINKLNTGIKAFFNEDPLKIVFFRVSSRVYDLKAATASGKEINLIIKEISYKDINKLFGILVKAQEVFLKTPDLRTNRPLFLVDNNIVFEKIQNARHLNGVIFDNALKPVFLRVNMGKALELTKKCAHWLAVFQNSAVSPAPGDDPLKIFSAEAVENDLKNLSRIGFAADEAPKVRALIARDLDKISSLALDKVGYHGDLHFDNFLIDDRAVFYGIDFGNFDIRTRYDDIALFGLYLDLIPSRILFPGKALPADLGKMKKAFYAECRVLLGDKFDPPVARLFEFRYLVHIIANEFIICSEKPYLLNRLYFGRILKVLERSIAAHEYASKQ